MWPECPFISHILWFDNTEERGKYHQHLFNMGVIQKWTSYVDIWIQKGITRLLRKGPGRALNGSWILTTCNETNLFSHSYHVPASHECEQPALLLSAQKGFITVHCLCFLSSLHVLFLCEKIHRGRFHRWWNLSFCVGGTFQGVIVTYLRCVVAPPCAMATRMPPWSPHV